MPLDPSFLQTGGGALVTYLLIAGLVAGDGIVPTIPGEAALIGGGILAANGDLALAAVIAAGVVGGFAGDNASFGLGSRYGPAVSSRLFRSQRSQRRLAWARDRIAERGELIILTARFIPAGRTATTFAAGGLGMAWRRFAPADLTAVCAWALYASLAGFAGGRALGGSAVAVLAGSIAIAAIIGLVSEVMHRSRRRARSRAG